MLTKHLKVSCQVQMEILEDLISRESKSINVVLLPKETYRPVKIFLKKKRFYVFIISSVLKENN